MVDAVAQSRRAALVGPVLALLTLALYLPTLGFSFVDLDDPMYVTHNPHLGAGLDARSFWWAWSSVYFGWWHPLTWLSHLLDVRLFGFWAGGHHLTSALWHAANAWLALVVLRRFGLALGPAAAAAALWAWHPLRAESVAWVSERKDVLSVAFALGTLWAWARFRERRTFARGAAVAALYAAALASKSMMVTLPVLMALYELLPGWTVPADWRRRLAGLGPLFVLALASGLVTLWAQRSLGVVAALQTVPLVDRLERAPVALVRYLAKTVWPVSLGMMYPTRPVALWEWSLSLGLLAALSLLAWRARRAAPGLLFGWLWFVVMLAPVLGVLQAGEQALADRYTYLAHLGLFAGVACSVPAASRRVAGALVAAALVPLVALSSLQIATWQDTPTLYAHALEVEPDNPPVERLSDTYALQTLLDQRRFDEAVAKVPQVVARWPGHPRILIMAGSVYAQAGRYPQAVQAFEAALAVEPGNQTAQRLLEFARADAAKASAPPAP